jgi:hypothetical protein
MFDHPEELAASLAKVKPIQQQQPPPCPVQRASL